MNRNKKKGMGPDDIFFYFVQMSVIIISLT